MFLGVEFSWEAGHGGGGGDLGVDFALESPAGVIGEVEVEGVVFVAGEDFDLFFEEFDGLVVSTGV